MREKFLTYGVNPSDREPLIAFMVRALEEQGCRIISKPSAKLAPFRFTFETAKGERIGIVAYAFLANNKKVKNRPPDEHRFQIKYGGDLSGLHELWQDPYGLYVTLLLGINPDLGFFVAADPILRNPTRFSVSVEFKDKQADIIRDTKWFAWERERRPGKKTKDEPLFEALLARAELMRLQTFPDDYFIAGGLSEVHRQIGNAVPSALAEVLALEIRRQFLDEHVPPRQPRLIPPKRPQTPKAESIQPVPAKYRRLAGLHEPHPGTGMGYGAQRRAA